MNPTGKGLAIATAVAALVLAGNASTVAQDKDKAKTEVKCVGLNDCKGKGACKSARNDCKGKNACKGKGFVTLASAEECTQKGGKVEKQ
ncbi:MAG TPA: hypothetical protein VNN07_08025 [Candidatus Tectomicrobia bacterium]|nr:hypothetical protein [Candidatus Tectomicrobia bacterium]